MRSDLVAAPDAGLSQSRSRLAKDPCVSGQDLGDFDGVAAATLVNV